MRGFLFIDKETDMTSHDAVAISRKRLSIRRIGHTGTLDPFATGLLILAVGSYTRLIPLFDEMTKTYIAEGVFGETRDTEDSTGEVEETFPPHEIARDALDKIVATQFTGTITQPPPKFSAIKVNGKRAYKLARKGKEVTVPPRDITVHDITLVDYTYPRFIVAASVSKGTYIRSLIRDIGTAAGGGAYTNMLRRTAIGRISVEDATSVREVTEASLVPFIDVFPEIPQEHAPVPHVRRRLLTGDPSVLVPYPEGRRAFYDEEKHLLALIEKTDGKGRYIYVRPSEG